MSSGAGEKLPKGKARNSVPQKTARTGKGKDRISVSENRFRGDGVKFKCKLIGSVDVRGPRGDSMCAEGIKKLKAQAKQLNKEIGEHKQKITLFVTIKGIRIVDEKTQIVQHLQPINKISFITHDPEDKKIFGYVCSQPCTTGHKLFAIKSDKSAGVVTGTLYDLFQVVFKLRKEAESKKKVLNNAMQVSNGPSQQSADGIYEVPFKNGSGSDKSEKHSLQLEHEYAMPTSSSSTDPHYKVPCATTVEASPSPDIGDIKKSNIKEPEQESKLPKETALQPEDNSSQDVGFFSPSVFESAQNMEGMAETTSLASAADVHVFRSDSVSSASSEAFESRNADSRSSSLNQPPGNETLSPVNQSSGSFQVAFSTVNDSATVNFSEIQSDTSEKATGDGNVPLDFTPSDKACKCGTQNVPLNHDPFAPAEIITGKESSIAPEATDSFAAFDVAFGGVEARRDEEGERENIAVYNDPFAPSEGFKWTNASETAKGFDADFDSTQFPSSSLNLDLSEGPIQETNELDNKEEPSQDTEQQFSVSWDNVFVAEETSSAVEELQNLEVSDQQRSWKETFTSDTSDESSKRDFTPSTPFSWDEAFGTATSETADSPSTNIVQDTFSWDDAFGKNVAESSPLEFDSSPFDDAFSAAFVEKKISHLTSKSEPDMPQASKPKHAPLSGDTEITVSAFPSIHSDSSENIADSQNPLSSKDDYDELSLGFSSSAAGIEKRDAELSKPVVQVSDAKMGVPSSELPDEFQADFSQLSSGVSLENSEKPAFAKDFKKETGLDCDTQWPMRNDDCFTDVKQDSYDEKTELVLGDEPKIPSLKQPASASIPPPLPPRPIVSPPPLPARPTSLSSASSCTSTGKSPGSPQMATESPKSNSPYQLKKGWGKKPPPAPPPRVDLHEKPKESSKMDASENLFSSGVLGGIIEGSGTTTKHESPLLNTPWRDVCLEDKRSGVSDPFSEDFFTNFDFPQETSGTSAASSDNDPFASTQSVDPFAAPFGDQDVFSSFPPAQRDSSLDDLDPFSGDLSDSFAVFPCKDPFSDISDPFADRGVLSNDPFGDSPRKVNPGEAISLSESAVASHQEADSFA